MGRGDRRRVRWANDRKRSEKERQKRHAQERGEQRKAAKK